MPAQASRRRSPICCLKGPCCSSRTSNWSGLASPMLARERSKTSGGPSPSSTRSRPIRPERRLKRRSRRDARLASPPSSASAAEARWMSPSSPPTCSAPATISTTIWGVDIAKGQRLPLVLVPTTAGTGSEATPISVITCEGGVKLAVNARPLTADWAVLDPQLTVGLPRGRDCRDRHRRHRPRGRSLHVGTARRTRSPTRLPARRCGCLPTNLLTACNEPANLAAREAMLLGAHLAGLAFSNAPVAGVHALAYPLGGLHHLPHGVSNALMLRHVLAAQCRSGARSLCRARADRRSGLRGRREARRASPC